jgi:hypothetical protein
MINSIEELCDKALEYILSISIGNKGKRYTPTGNLSSTSTTNLKDYNCNIQYPGVNSVNTKTATFSIRTSGTIPEKYLKSVTNTQIKTEWNAYRDSYIYKIISPDNYVSVSSMILFLYYFRYFVDKKFCMFTDIYASSSVWLYNTEKVTYAPKNILLNGDFTLTTSEINNYMNILIDEITSGDTLKVLNASTSCSSCSSSSSSSSSSCSCSSAFIIYFNIG